MHFGIKGMHWGFRKQRAPVPRHIPKKKSARDINRSRRYISRHAYKLSNKDLARRVKRLKQEMELREYTRKLTRSPAYNAGYEVANSVGKKLLIGSLTAIGMAASNKYIVRPLLKKMKINAK